MFIIKIIVGILISSGSAVYAQIGEPYRLNGPLVASGGVATSFDGAKVSADSQHVIYTADQDEDEVFELYSVPITGGNTVQLNSNLPLNGDVNDMFQISADSQRVIYVADQDQDEVFELFSVAITGGTPVQLNADLTTGGDIRFDTLLSFTSNEFQISPNSQHVIYIADQDQDEVFELFSVPITGGTPVKLNGNITTGGDVNFFRISSDSQRVIYLSDQDEDNVFELYSASITGGNPVRLNNNLPMFGDVDFLYEISPDSQHVVFLAGINPSQEIYTVPVTGGSPVRINNDGVAMFLRALAPQISPDSQHIMYIARRFENNAAVNELFIAPITGGTPRQLNSTLPIGGNAVENSTNARFSADSQHVVYLADQNVDQVFELFSVPVSADSPPIRLNPDLPRNGDVRGFEISSDSQNVVYRAAQNVGRGIEIFTVPITGGNPVQLNSNLTTEANVQDFNISADSQRVVYRDVVNENELFSAPITGVTPPVQLSTEGRVLLNHFISPNGAFVIYRVGSSFSEAELFAHQLKEVVDDAFCFPIKASNDDLAVICL